MIDHCNEPMAKHCRLCRIRRMNEVELRMRTNQIPTNLKVKNLPGNLPLYSHAQIWQADDEQLFTLNPEKGYSLTHSLTHLLTYLLTYSLKFQKELYISKNFLLIW